MTTKRSQPSRQLFRRKAQSVFLLQALHSIGILPAVLGATDLAILRENVRAYIYHNLANELLPYPNPLPFAPTIHLPYSGFIRAKISYTT